MFVTLGFLMNFQKLKVVFNQFVKFGLVGVSNILVSYLVYLLLTLINVPYLIANAIGYIVSILNAFYWNYKFVFKPNEKENFVWWKVLLKTFIAYSGSGLVLSSILLVLFIDYMGFDKVIAPILTLFITVPISFLVNKFWAFKYKKVKTSQEDRVN